MKSRNKSNGAGRSKRFDTIHFGRSATNLSKQRPTTRKEDTSKGITLWEAEGSRKNDFPQQLINNIDRSPTASACIDIWHDFLLAEGFVNDDLNKVKINKEGETVADLLDQVTHDMSYFEGFAVHIEYSFSTGKPVAFHYQPFEQTRLGEVSENGKVKDIKTNPYFGMQQDYDEKYTKTYYTYNPDPIAVKKEMAEHYLKYTDKKVDYKYPGQIFWFSIERPLARIYPVPFFYSANLWFEVDGQIQEFHERNISNNFLLSVVMNVFGDPDAPANKEDENKDNYETQAEAFNDQVSNTLTGSKNGGTALVNWIKNADEKIDISEFPSNTHEKLFTELQRLTTDQICIGTKTPPILVGVQVAGKLGNTQEILNAVKVMQARVAKKQRIVADCMRKLLLSFDDAQGYNSDDYKMTRYNMVDILPDAALKDMTQQERRKYWRDNYNVDIQEEVPTGLGEQGDTTQNG